MLIKCEKCQESRNTAVTIAEGMNTQEIECEAGNSQQWRYMLLVDCVAVGQTQFLRCPWGLRCRDRTETHHGRAARAKLHDLIINALPLASIASSLLDGAV